MNNNSDVEKTITDQGKEFHESKNSDELTLDALRNSNHPALERIASRAAENMTSSAYTSHNSHYSAHND